MALPGIEHLVVVMMENRSFDNTLGWLYDAGDPPPNPLPPGPPVPFDGLASGGCSNQLTPAAPPLFASHPPSAWPSCANPNQVPTPDPQEEFDHVTAQLFGNAASAAAAALQARSLVTYGHARVLLARGGL